FEWVHVQLHQQKGMISLSPPTICNSAHRRHALFGVLIGKIESEESESVEPIIISVEMSFNSQYLRCRAVGDLTNFWDDLIVPACHNPLLDV
ncbi:hypothetical protein VBL73_22955, partial [Enterobacter hormaechei]|nr:hypothetical protein [Enterobacter hormaechei]